MTTKEALGGLDTSQWDDSGGVGRQMVYSEGDPSIGSKGSDPVFDYEERGRGGRPTYGPVVPVVVACTWRSRTEITRVSPVSFLPTYLVFE